MQKQIFYRILPNSLLATASCAKHTYMGGLLLPVLMLVPYIMSPVRATLFLCHQLHREGAQVPFSWGSQTLLLKQMLFPALQEYCKRKQCLGFLFKMQNCLLGVLHLLREQKARTHILEQTPGQCSFNRARSCSHLHTDIWRGFGEITLNGHS